MSPDPDAPSGRRIAFVRGGVPDDPGVARAIALALGAEPDRAVPTATAWWWAGASALLTGRIARSPSELPDRRGAR